MADRVGQQLGNYRLSRLLGRGGFAEVYLGEHVYLKTPTAIKILQGKLANEQDLQAFLTEAQTIAQLVHSHIVRVLDFGVDEETSFLVMDYALGGTLRQRHPRGTQWPLTTIVSYIKQVAEALQYAHEEKFIHRDVKPENMLVGRRDEVLLSDFGIALIAQSSRYQSTQDVIGTIAYMSPEQIQGRPRLASDQYSLGIVVYEWLCGDRPFHGSFTELCTQHLFAEPAPLHEKIPTLSSIVEHVVLRALTKDYRDRFVTIEAFARALEEASHTEAPAISILPLPPHTVAPSSREPTLRHSTQEAPEPVPSPPSAPSAQPLPITRSDTGEPARSNLPEPHIPLPTSEKKAPSAPLTPLALSSLPTSLPASRQRHSWTKRVFLIALMLLVLALASTSSFSGSIALRNVPSPAMTATAAAKAYEAFVTAHGMMFGFDAQHSHNNIYEHILNVANVSRLHPLWTTSTADQRGVFSFTLANGVIYAGSHNSTVYAFDAVTGRQKWQSFSPSGSVDSTPAVINGIVYVGCANKKLYALDAATGQQKWAASTSDIIVSSPAVTNGVVYVGSVDHKLYAFDAATGHLKWVSPSTGGGIWFSSPAVENGVVYVGSGDNKLYAFDTATGQQKWAASMGNPPIREFTNSSPTVANGIVYVGSANDRKLYAFDAVTGQQKWAAPCGTISSSPAVANGIVYSESDNFSSDLTSDDRDLYAFDAMTGQQKWTVLIGNPLTSSSGVSGTYSSPTVANGVVYAGSDHLYAYDAVTGQQKWVASTVSSIDAAAPIVANGVVYAAGSGNLYAFSL